MLHSWKEQLSCSGSVDEGPTKNSEPIFILMPCIALVHSYVFRVCVCVGGGGGRVCKSHEL